MRYGSHISLTKDGEVIKQTEETFVNYHTLHKIERYNESLLLKNEDEALAVFLKLMEDRKKGLVNDYGVLCYSDKDSQRLKRVEKIWTIWT